MSSVIIMNQELLKTSTSLVVIESKSQQREECDTASLVPVSRVHLFLTMTKVIHPP